MKRKSVIFIHGIGPQVVGYSDYLWNVLWVEERPADITKYEMFYYDIFEMTNAKLEIKKLTEKYDIAAVLGKLTKNIEFPEKINQELSKLLEDTVSHVLYFLLLEDVKTAILNKFRAILVKAIDEGKKAGIYPSSHEITVISHSLGTVVAYTGLHIIICEESLGLQDGVTIKNLFTLASPLAFIKGISSKLQIELPYITSGIGKPEEWNPVKEMNESNVRHWYSYRHRFDLVASLMPLVGEFLDNKDELPYVFNIIYRGNVHSFDNYVIQARDVISNRIKE